MQIQVKNARNILSVQVKDSGDLCLVEDCQVTFSCIGVKSVMGLSCLCPLQSLAHGRNDATMLFYELFEQLNATLQVKLGQIT